MIVEKRDWLSMLRELDEALPPRDRRQPGDHIGWEIPRGFDRAAAQSRFDLLAERLSEAFGVHVVADAGPEQDAASFGTIDIPQEYARSHAKHPDHRFPLTVTVSNFGNLATYRHVRHTFSAFDDHDAPDAPAVHPADARQIEEVLAALDYVAVPEDVLDAPFDGPNSGPSSSMDWYARFFGVL